MKMLRFIYTGVLAVTVNAFRLPCGLPHIGQVSPERLQAIVNGTMDPGSLGAATVVGPGGPSPWPRDKENIVTIRYCFKDQGSRANLRQGINEAIAIWEDALGGPASKDTRHGLRFVETMKPGFDLLPEYCYKRGEMDDWNPAIPEETLVIMFDDFMEGASATIGFSENPDFSEPWRLVFTAGLNVGTHVFAHELGHVLGFAHEHQRSDRDDYVIYKCQNLRSYKQSLRMASGQDKPKLCTDWAVAFKYGFIGTECIAVRIRGGLTGKTYDIKPSILEYDYDSITHYSTFDSDAASGCTEKALDKCALVRYKDPAHPERGVRAIPDPMKPSKLDAAWVKLTYPWLPPPKA